ncbi:MAG: hypothetical protein QW594_03115 [Candidatus Woesearchaeota archaeon]
MFGLFKKKITYHDLEKERNELLDAIARLRGRTARFRREILRHHIPKENKPVHLPFPSHELVMLRRRMRRLIRAAHNYEQACKRFAKLKP